MPPGGKAPSQTSNRVFSDSELFNRSDVLVHAEQVVGIVTELDFTQAAVIRAIRLFDSVSFIVRHEIDIHATRGEGCCGLKESTSPCRAVSVLCLVAPAAMRIHYEMSV